MTHTPSNDHPASPLSALSEHVADVVAAAAPGVVSVTAGRRRASGLVWDVDGGTARVLTVAAAVRELEEVEVVGADGTARTATVLGTDRATDLALLAVPELDATPSPRGDTATVRVGQLVLTLGRPGESVRASLGLVSAVGGVWRTAGGAPIARHIDVDGSLPGGCPGGPLLSTDGAVLGLNTRGLVHGGTTVPVETLAELVDLLAAGGRSERGWLGVTWQEVTLGEVEAKETGQSQALLLTGVRPGGPAAGGGLRLGDIVFRIDESPVFDFDTLVGALAHKAGQSVQVHALRGGTRGAYSVTPIARRRRGGGHGRWARRHAAWLCR